MAITGLKPVHYSNNSLLKYEDDSHILIPVSTIATISSEFENVAKWAPLGILNSIVINLEMPTVQVNTLSHPPNIRNG